MKTNPQAHFRKPARLLTIKEAAAMLGIGRHRLGRAVRAKQVKAIRVFARPVIPLGEVRRLLAGQIDARAPTKVQPTRH